MVEEVIGVVSWMRALIDVTISALYLFEENDSRCRNSWRHNAAAEGCKYPVHTHAFAYFMETIVPRRLISSSVMPYYPCTASQMGLTNHPWHTTE